MSITKNFELLPEFEKSKSKSTAKNNYSNIFTQWKNCHSFSWILGIYWRSYSLEKATAVMTVLRLLFFPDLLTIPFYFRREYCTRFYMWNFIKYIVVAVVRRLNLKSTPKRLNIFSCQAISSFPKATESFLQQNKTLSELQKDMLSISNSPL